MKKYEVIKKSTDFSDIIKNGGYKKAKYFNIYYKDGLNNYPKFGLAVSKKCGNAVVRNKIKRQLRMIIDNNKKLFKKSYNYIIMVKRGINEVPYQEIEDEVKKILDGGI